MRKKGYTTDCVSCNFMVFGDKMNDNKCVAFCTWGKSKEKKILFTPLGKKPLKCKLKK